MTTFKVEHRIDAHGERIYITREYYGTWVIVADKQLGISIDCLGASTIPRCPPVEERVRSDPTWPPPESP